MITVSNVSLQFGQRKLFSEVNIIFSPGNCYGLIGANGSGKSTFLNILSGEIDSTAGEVSVAKGKRLSVLKQDQFAFDAYSVLTTVIMGHKRLYDLMREKDAICAKPDFSDADGLRVSELEGEFAEMGGWNAEADASKLLADLGVPAEMHALQMSQLEGRFKVRVLLAQALFGNPDILLLDEPTNHLDVETCLWLEEFLSRFENTAIVVSHDRHFLDNVCTHIADIDYSKIKMHSGNYTFWSESSRLAAQQRSQTNKKLAERRKELQEFVARFGANLSKAKQATSRQKLLDKLTIEDIEPSSRKYPYVHFEQEREAGNDLLSVDGLSKSVDGQVMFSNLAFTLEKGEKVAFVGPYELARTKLFQILMGEIEADAGTFKWGFSTKRAYFPKDNAAYFNAPLNMMDWLRQYSEDKSESFIRGFLGKVLFSGEESQKAVNVLSGGEKVRCMLSRMMLMKPNVVILDEPTNHLDLESITALNEGLKRFKGTLLISSHDHELVQTIANRIIEITPRGIINRVNTTYDEYLADARIRQLRQEFYS
ncbi:MAG: ABC-F family ATP-binding cassette domain-containing protein [Candidatus Brocadiia bacterium]